MKYHHPEIETEVKGNSLHLRKWNEASFKISTVHPDHVHNLYPIRKPNPNGRLRYLNLGAVDPIEIPIGYELNRHIKSEDITVTTSWSNQPAMMYFGEKPASDYVGVVDIPEFRAVSRPSNPFYMDSGLVLIDIQYNGHDINLQEQLNAATQQVLKETCGIDSYNKGAKLYYKDGQNDVKISSPETAEGHTWTYINIDTNYLKAYDYYIVPKDIRDPFAYGLKKNYPKVDNNIVNKIIHKLSELADLKIYNSSYTIDENKEINRLKTTHSDKQWVRNAIRNDPGWGYFDDEGHEYEIILNKMPASNIIPMAVETENLIFYYQGRETNPNARRQPQVEGSYAIYHADESRHNIESTWKFGHIYRPWAVDSSGNKVWCDFNKDFDGTNNLEVHVPKDFLVTAKYPITIDPTFGYSSIGASFVYLINNNTSTAYANLINISGIDGQIQSINAWSDPNSFDTTIDYLFAIYDSSRNIIDYSNKITNPVGVGGNQPYSLPVINKAKSTTQSYNLGIFVNFTFSGGIYDFFSLQYDTVSNAGGLYNSNVAPVAIPIVPEPITTNGDNKWSIWVSYNTYANVAWISA